MEVKLFDLYTENSWIKEGFFERLSDLYDESNFTLGYSRGPVEELEDIFCKFCGRQYALGVNSGTFALEMASFALDLHPEDEVIVPANTFIATASAPARYGATIVEADVDPETWNLNKESVEKVISEHTRAIFAVNLYGNPFPYDELKDLGIPLVEDAAHSHGTEYKGKMSGSLGNYSVFSFFPAKVFGAIGDAGMLLFDKDEQYEVLHAYRNCGQAKSHYATVLASVGRLHVVQALFLVEKWKIFHKALAHRRHIAEVYDEHFRETPVKPQRVLDGCKSSYFAYVVRVPNRDAVGTRLKKLGIPWTIQYRYLLHQQPFWKRIKTRSTETPIAEEVLSEIMSLPMNCSVTEEQAAYVADALLHCVGR